MPDVAKCPKCRGPIRLTAADADGKLKCPSCGASIRVRRPDSPRDLSPAAPTPIPTTRKPDGPAPAADEWDDLSTPDGWDDTPAASEWDDPVAGQAESEGDDADGFAWEGVTAEDLAPEPSEEADDDLGFDPPGQGFRSPPIPGRKPASAGKKSDAAAGPSKAAKSKKPAKKSRSSGGGSPFAAGLGDRRVLLAVGGAGLLVALVAIGAAAWAFRGGGNGEAANAQAANGPAPAGGGLVVGDFGPLKRTSAPVLLDRPVPGVAVAAEPVAPLFQPAPAYDEATAATRDVVEPAYERAAPEPKAGAPKPIESDDRVRWTAEPDPLPADRKYVVAPNLSFELRGPIEVSNDTPERRATDAAAAEKLGLEEPDERPHWGSLGQNVAPTLAGPDGPYAVFAPLWPEIPYARRSPHLKKPTKKPVGAYSIVEVPQDPIPVVDLRTGESAGAFDWHIPFWLNPALGPDGKYLVGPYHVPMLQSRSSRMTDEETANRRALHVWERDAKGPPKALAVTGPVPSIAFAGPTTLTVLAGWPPRQLQIWDVAAAKQTAAVDLPDPLTDQPFEGSSLDEHLDLVAHPPWTQNILAISPGGRYAAVAGSKGVTLISIPEARVVGTLETGDLNGAADDFRGLFFPSSGDELAVAHATVRGETRFVRARIADGAVLARKDLGGSSRGLMWVHPGGRSFFLGDYPKRFQEPDPKLFDLEKAWAEDQFKASPVLRMPEEGPLLVCRLPARYDETAPQIPTVVALDREAYFAKVDERMRVDDVGLPKRTAVAAGDRSAMKVVEVAPPAAWAKMPPIPPTKPFAAKELGRVAWPAAWADARAVSIVDSHRVFDRPWRPDVSGVPGLEIAVRSVDLAEGAAGDPIVLLPWAIGPNNPAFYPHTRGSLPIGLSADGSQLAVVDPETRGRIDLWGPDGERLWGFTTGAEPPEPIRWLDFDAAGRLFVLQGGGVSAWDLAEGVAKGVYSVSAGYTLPAAFAPGRSLLAVSRGGSFDLIDAATGACLNRFGAGGLGTIVDVAFSPDGKRVAAIYIAEPDRARHFARRTGNPDYTTGQLVLGDLADGRAVAREVALGGTAFLSWAGPEHLCVGSDSAATVFDLKLGEHTVSYVLTDRNVPAVGNPIERSPDGRLWYASPAAEAKEGEFAHSWRLSSLSGEKSADERPYYAADRAIFDAAKTPIRLELDLGDAEQAETHGKKVLGELQGRGYRIGDGGALLRVTMDVKGSGESIVFRTFSVEIPLIVYDWRLIDAGGREVWAGKTVGAFRSGSSKYYEEPSLQERRSAGEQSSGAAQHFNFGLKEPATAILEEILELGSGLSAPGNLPRRLLLGDGKYLSYPRSFHWDGTAVPEK